jgi:hypothetical protein
MVESQYSWRHLLKRLLSRQLERESWVGVRIDTLAPYLRPSLPFDVWLGENLCRRSLVRTLRCEIGSFFQRIRWLLETELYQRGVVIHFQSHLGLTQPESKRAEDGYTTDSNSLYVQFPWLTLVDERIFAEGWTKGAAWAYRNSRSEPVSSGSYSRVKQGGMLLYDKLTWDWDCRANPEKIVGHSES